MKNRFELIGRIVKDHELKTLKSGDSVLNFSLAQNHTWKDKNGEKQEKAEYFDITAFGKVAEIIAKFTWKGNRIAVSGIMENNNFEKEKDGKNFSYRTHKFTVKDFTFIDFREPKESPETHDDIWQS